VLNSDDRERLKSQVQALAGRIAVFRPTDGPERWSLAEGQIPPALLDEAQAYLCMLEPPAVKAALDTIPSPFGLILAACFSQHARKHAAESDTWSALTKVVPKASYLLFPEGFPTQDLYNSLEAGLEHYKLRTSGPRGEGQYFVVSLRLQIGFTENGFRSSWQSWIDQPPEAVDLLSQGCESFRRFWNVVRSAAKCRLGPNQVFEALKDSPWVSEVFVEELISLLTGTPRDRLRLTPVRLEWPQEGDPHAAIDLSLLFGDRLREGNVYVDGERCARLIERQGGRLSLPDGTLCISAPFAGPECVVEISNVEDAERVALWDASVEASKVECARGQRIYASRNGVFPEPDTYSRYKHLSNWTLWDIRPGIARFQDEEGGVVLDTGSPPAAIEVGLRVSQDFKKLGDSVRLRLVLVDGSAERVRIGEQTSRVENGDCFVRVTPELAARAYAPRVRVRTDSSVREVSAQRTRIRAYGIAHQTPQGNSLVEDGAVLEPSQLGDLTVVTPEPGWIIAEGPVRIAVCKEGSSPFPWRRLLATGEAVTLRQAIVDKDILGFTVRPSWQHMPDTEQGVITLRTTRHLESTEAKAYVLGRSGLVECLPLTTSAGLISIDIAEAPLALSIFGRDGDVLESGWSIRALVEFIGTDLDEHNAEAFFRFVRSTMMPFHFAMIREPLRKAIGRLAEHWLRAWIPVQAADRTVEARRGLAAGRLLHAARATLDLQCYQRLRRFSGLVDPDFCVRLSDIAPLDLKDLVRLLPRSAKDRIAQEIRELTLLPDDDDDLDESVSEQLTCSTGDATAIHRTLAGLPTFSRASYLEEAAANSAHLRRRLAVHWLEDRQ
jgi:hypothetical protein